MVICRSAKVAILFFASIACCKLPAQTQATPADDTLLRAFSDPPNSAKPRVWWRWMNGNITPEGIKLDLDWMHRVGIGGVMIEDCAIDTPQVVPHRLVYMTPAWKQAFSDAVTSAKDLGMEVSIANSPGWAETGGPWVPPSQAIKKMVWSTTRIEGDKPFVGTLAHPPETTGDFQNVKREATVGPVLPQFYADAAVVAYRIPEEDKSQAELNPRVTTSGGAADVSALSDGDIEKVALLLSAGAPGSEPWTQFDYGQPQKIQAITLATLDDMRSVFDFGDESALPRLEAGDDGEHFRKVADISSSSVPQRTIAFSAVTARYFRLVFPPQSVAGNSGQPVAHKITELVLSSGARVNEFEKRAGFANVRDYYAIPNPDVAPEFVVSRGDVIDLTGRMKPDGTLDWTPPPGNWMVLRIGYSLTGHENGPAPAEATGLEVDKLNKQYVRNYLEGYLKMYSDAIGADRMGSSGVSHFETDSIEVGAQNWTDNILDEFKQRRGYDPHPWLPALTGAVIKSAADTDRFLWDFRRTIAQLIAENHYGEISDGLHRHGMKSYGEALEFHRPTLGDDMEMRSKMDIPMGALWTYKESGGLQSDYIPGPGTPNYVICDSCGFKIFLSDYIADLRGAASVAHIYGQNLVGAESMTSNGPAWGYSPVNLKRIADLELALGVNLFMIHESSHQPVVDRAPGITLGTYGLMFTRNETWAEEAGPWITYLARSSYLLQQGHFFADVAYFYGEEAPLTALFGWKPQQDAPIGYGFDFVNSDVILNHLSFQNGRLVTPGGTSYRILYLGESSRRMTLPVLRRIQDLVSQGAFIVGGKPTDSPSLSDDEIEFHKIADKLWGRGQPALVHSYGKGRVYSGKTANEVLAALHVAQDFEYTKPEADTTLMFVHRRLGDEDIYFVDNRKDRAEAVDATFRVDGKAPELWDAATGQSKPASYRIADGRTTVPLHLDPFGTVFVVFRAPAAAQSEQLPQPVVTRLSTPEDSLDRDWNVGFQSDRGAPERMHFDRLTSWSDNSNEGVKYFSGTAEYNKIIQAPENWFNPGAHLWLDLGDVHDITEVAVNGKSLGILWKNPFQVDLTGVLVPGSNSVTIKVTNLWVNRLIGDQQPWAVWKYTFTDIQPYNANSPLLPSGLLGPLEILSVAEK